MDNVVLVSEFLEAVEKGRITDRNIKKHAGGAELCEQGGYFVNDGGAYRLTSQGRRELGLYRMREEFMKRSGYNTSEDINASM